MKKVIFDKYSEQVCKVYGIDLNDLFSSTKKREVSDARQLLYFLCYKRPMRKVEIVRYMKEEGLSVTPTNINYAINKIKNKVKEDQDYIHVINKINSCITP